MRIRFLFVFVIQVLEHLRQIINELILLASRFHLVLPSNKSLFFVYSIQKSRNYQFKYSY